MSNQDYRIQSYFQKGKTVVLTLKNRDNEKVRQWTDVDTHNLLARITKYFPQFRDFGKRKKEVWTEISIDLNENESSNWSAEDCRKKWSNMIRTFKGIQDQQQRSPNAKITWPFFRTMMNLFTSTGADCLPEASGILQLISKQSEDNEIAVQNNPAESSEEQKLFLFDNCHETIVYTDEMCNIDLVSNEDCVHNNSEVNNADVSNFEQSTRTLPLSNVDPLALHEDSSKEIIKRPRYRSNRDSQKQVRNNFKRRRTLKDRKNNALKTKHQNDLDPVFNNFLSTIISQNNKIIEMLSTLTESNKNCMMESNSNLKRLCNLLERKLDDSERFNNADCNLVETVIKSHTNSTHMDNINKLNEETRTRTIPEDRIDHEVIFMDQDCQYESEAGDAHQDIQNVID